MRLVSSSARGLLLSAALAALPAHAGAPAGLDRASIRATHPALSDGDFARKWAASLTSPVMFLRSYPAAYHRSLARTPAIGAAGLCVGDAHPGNFGFLLVGGRSRFAYNDLDDAGYCPVAFDALRYFTAVRIFFEDDRLTADVLERYVDAVKDPKRASGVAKGLYPSWDKVRAKGLAEHVRGDKLVGAELGPVRPAMRAAIQRAMRGVTIVDVAALARDLGGSGGLRRYWLLVDRGGARTVLELKEATTPGVEWGRRTKTLPFAARLPVLKAALWGTRADDDYYYVALGRSAFLVRDRFTKKSLKVEELGGKDRKDVLQAQASYLALLHAAAWSAVKKDDLRAWLWRESHALAAAWRAAYQVARR